MALGRVSMMYEQALDVLKGWFHLAALDKSAKLASTLLAGATAVPAGRVAVLNDDGEFVLDRIGGTVTASRTAMPIFLWNGSNHPDVYNDGTSPTAIDNTGNSIVNWIGISPTGVMSGLVATGGYELQTTEFDSTQTYHANTPLTATRGNNSAALDGILTSATATPYTNWICGICSFHVQGDNQSAAATGPDGYNAHGMLTLSFWSYFLPAGGADAILTPA